MPNKDDSRDQEFKKAEEAIHIKCDVHRDVGLVLRDGAPVLRGHGDDGSFSIPSDCRTASTASRSGTRRSASRPAR
jgi:hypothetical protein